MILFRKIFNDWLKKSRELNSNVYALYRAMNDPRVPLLAKFLTMLVVAYIISPVDLIPDFIPVLGLLDEIVLVPVFLSLIMHLIPAEIIMEYNSEQQEINNRGLKIAGVIIVILIWIGLTALFYFSLSTR